MLQHVHQFLDQSDYARSTCGSYGYVLKRLSDWLDSHQLDVAGLDPTTFRQFLRDQEWGNNLQRLASNATRAFFRWHFGDQHPLLAYAPPKDNSGPQRTFDLDQVFEILLTFDTSRPTGWRNLAIVVLIFETGLRSSEICALRLRYLDLKRRTVAVIAKGGQWRQAVFSQYVASCLDTWLQARSQIACPGVDTVFISVRGRQPGRPLTPAGLRAIFQRIGKRADLPGFSPHDLRRTMAVCYHEAGASTRAIQLLGGWATIGMVVRYTRALSATVKDVDRYSALPELFGLKKEGR